MRPERRLGVDDGAHDGFIDPVPLRGRLHLAAESLQVQAHIAEIDVRRGAAGITAGNREDRVTGALDLDVGDP